MRALLFLVAASTAGCAPSPEPQRIALYTYEVVHTYPHDATAYTEGLLYHDGFVYESTGIEERSSIRKVKLETGEIVQQRHLPGQYFGEGIVIWKDRLVQLTYKTEKGFVYDLATFQPKSEFTYRGEGCALTTDGKRLIIAPAQASGRRKKSDAAQDWAHKRYGKAFQKLAE